MGLADAWVSPPSADRAAALLLLASEAWVGVSSRLRTLLSTGAANERRADSSAVDFSGLVVGCVLAPTREREELRFFWIGPVFSN